MEAQGLCSLIDCEPIAAEGPRPDVRFQRLRLSAILVGAGQEGFGSAGAMAHEIGKLLLEYADSFLERTEAIKVAMSLGMALREIEEYLDWLDASKPPRAEGRPGQPGHREPRGRS
jgi:hypothetical protein